MDQRLLTAVAAATLFLAPLAGASWMSYGTYEPDTAYDTTFMFPDPPGTVVKSKIYFNAFPKWGPIGGANGNVVNPNVGALETRMDPAGPYSFQAILGVWTDCNGDGYVGMAETAVREYKSELLTNTGLCPPRTGGIGNAPTWEQRGAHNNWNGWVTEFISIGGPDWDRGDQRVYGDPEAMVWGDSFRPESDWPQQQNGCPVFPTRRSDGTGGESRTTGGIIGTIDCKGERGIVTAFNDADAAAGTGLGFDDPSDPHTSDSPLNMQTFGDDSSDHSAVRAQDCDAEPIVNTGDVPGGDDVDNIPVLRPVPADPVNPDTSSWTVPGTLNYTRESITVSPSGSADGGGGSDPTFDCDFENDGGRDFYGAIEGNPPVNVETGKRNAQWNFFFATASRGTLPATALGAGSHGVPTDFGVEALATACTASSCQVTQWVTGGITHVPGITRGGINNPSTEFADAPYWSFYAHVGEATLARGFQLPGGSGVYGAPQCGSETSGEHHGWNCDADAWYRDGNGNLPNSPRPLAKPGQIYEFRDVDCLDGSVGSTGLGISPSFFGTGRCV